ncbi:MAG: S8 family serine peptidase [Actinobacteria bacterium]|nr:S8 family serine peptidase [Actinomycetota bacterium]
MTALQAQAATSDKFFFSQWGLQRVGAEPAWAASRGANVIIADIDSGVDLGHPDLQGKLLPGHDFVNNPGNATCPQGNAQDDNGHGTLVAGIAAARTDNGIGIAAIAPDAMILPLKAFDANSNGKASDVTKAIDCARTEAANRHMPLVLNLSFVQSNGGNIFNDTGVDNAIKTAIAAGAAAIVAAGNDNKPQTQYDNKPVGVLVVGASDKQDARWSGSNYGPNLDLLAPGESIVSTWWDPNKQESTYGNATGTSMSVPFVAATAAMLMSRGFSNLETIQKITSHAKDLGAPGRDDQTGYGLLDTAAALGVARPSPPPSPQPKPSPSPVPSPSPSPSPSRSPLVFPPPNEPPPVAQIAASPSPGSPAAALGAIRRSVRLTPLSSAALAMVALIIAGHIGRFFAFRSNVR